MKSKAPAKPAKLDLSFTKLVTFPRSEINASSLETLSRLVDDFCERIERDREYDDFNQQTIDAIRTGGTVTEEDLKHLLGILDDAIWDIKFSLELLEDMFIFKSVYFEEEANEMRPLIDKEVLAVHYAKYTQAWLLEIAAVHNIEMEVAA